MQSILYSNITTAGTVVYDDHIWLDALLDKYTETDLDLDSLSSILGSGVGKFSHYLPRTRNLHVDEDSFYW
jgi:hypothetical protein